jgi:hypothetical protein
MAAKNSMSRARRAPKSKRAGVGSEVPPRQEAPRASSGGIPRALHVAIEAERSRLMRADAILHCAVLAMDEQGCPRMGAPDYQAVIDVARDMIGVTIAQLDSFSLLTVLRYVKAASAEGDEAQGQFVVAANPGVREPAAAYLH